MEKNLVHILAADSLSGNSSDCISVISGRGDLLCSVTPTLGTKGQNFSAERGQVRPGVGDQSDAVGESHPRLSQDSSVC